MIFTAETPRRGDAEKNKRQNQESAEVAEDAEGNAPRVSASL